MKDLSIYLPNECPFDPGAYPTCKRPRGNPKKKRQPIYINAVCAFDIEASTLPGDQAIMYVWQMQLENYTVMGRTWDEFLTFSTHLSTLAGERTLVI